MSLSTAILVICGVLAGLLGIHTARSSQGTSLRKALMIGAPFFLGSSLLLCGGYNWWLHHRVLPSAINAELSPGITHRRFTREHPRSALINVVSIDLAEPRIEFLVTPKTPTDGRAQKARTTTDFAMEHGTLVAINAMFFSPWTPGYFFYRPKLGEGVDVQGLAASNGQNYGRENADYTTMSITKDHQVFFGALHPDALNAVSGKPMLVRDGVIQENGGRYIAPRTAVCLTHQSKALLLVTVDGRQPNYSEGLTLSELATLMHKLGCDQALNLDGGGSTTMVLKRNSDRYELVNSPIHRRVPPGQERPIANHFGVLVRR